MRTFQEIIFLLYPLIDVLVDAVEILAFVQTSYILQRDNSFVGVMVKKTGIITVIPYLINADRLIY